jgi:hypothetical protein
MKSDGRDAVKAFATLRFAGDKLEPEKISAILNVRPTEAYRKGEQRAAGAHAPARVGRTGIWYLATDQMIPGQKLEQHLAFLLALLIPAPGDISRIAELREIIKRQGLKAHVSCFWHGKPGARKPTIPPIVREIFNLLPAELETDFERDEPRRRVA